MEKKSLKDYWIGDQVLLKKSRRKGVFAGIHDNGKARVKVEQKYILTSADNLIYVEPNKVTPLTSVIEDEGVDQSFSLLDFPRSIDLHIEKLDVSLQNALPQMIINKQLSACKAYVQKAINLGIQEMIIVHGKGAGQLKLEVDSVLRSFDEVMDTEIIHDGGATRVSLRQTIS